MRRPKNKSNEEMKEMEEMEEIKEETIGTSPPMDLVQLKQNFARLKHLIDIQERKHIQETLMVDLPDRLKLIEEQALAVKKAVKANQDFIKNHHIRISDLETDTEFLKTKKKK